MRVRVRIRVKGVAHLIILGIPPELSSTTVVLNGSFTLSDQVTIQSSEVLVMGSLNISETKVTLDSASTVTVEGHHDHLHHDSHKSLCQESLCWDPKVIWVWVSLYLSPRVRVRVRVLSG